MTEFLQDVLKVDKKLLDKMSLLSKYLVGTIHTNVCKLKVIRAGYLFLLSDLLYFQSVKNVELPNKLAALCQPSYSALFVCGPCFLNLPSQFPLWFITSFHFLIVFSLTLPPRLC